MERYRVVMRKIPTLLVLSAIFVLPVQGDDLENSTQIEITRSWTQEPGGWSWPIDISVPDTMPEGGFPVCVLLHGADTAGGALLGGFRDVLSDHVLVAPTGYELTWNICRETSKAPDVEMVRELIETIQGFDNVNPDAIRILGYSNGAALAHRVYIENDNSGIDAVVTTVSQLSDIQYHAGGYHMPGVEPDETADFCGYDTPVTPLTTRRYLNICNVNDPVIPYQGGISPVSEIAYLEARLSAFMVARARGYQGKPDLGDGVEIDSGNVFKYEYLDGEVVHLRGFEGHGLNQTMETFIGDFLSTWGGADDPCPGDFNGDGVVDGGDLGLMVAGWGTSEYDLTGDGLTDGADLGMMFSAWGECP